MKQATARKHDTPKNLQIHRRMREAAFILLSSLAIYLLIALLTYHEADPAWSHSGMSNTIHNAAGKAGAWIADILFSMFGYIAYIYPLAFGLGGTFVYPDPSKIKQDNPLMWLVRACGLLVSVIAACGLVTLKFTSVDPALPMSAGGDYWGWLSKV